MNQNQDPNAYNPQNPSAPGAGGAWTQGVNWPGSSWSGGGGTGSQVSWAQAYPAGYAPAGAQTGAQPGYPATGQPGYGAGAQPGYPAAGQMGYAAGSQPGYPTGAQPGYATGAQPGYPAGAQPGYPTGSQPGYSYIPQTPYIGYPPQGGHGTGARPGVYDPYAQMGRQPGAASPQYTGTAPLNGGGYVPQPVPLRKKPFALSDAALVVGCAVLLALFACGMFAPGLSVLKWVFLGLAAAAVTALWVRPMTAGNRRLCCTAVFGILMVVTLVSLFAGRGGVSSGDPQTTGSARTSAPASQSGPSGASGTSGGSGEGSGAGALIVVSAAPPTVTETPAPVDTSITDRLALFFRFWSVNSTDEMLSLCSPSWQSKTATAKADLFGLLANRTPKDFVFENVTGTEQDTSRTVTLNSLIDRNNGKDPIRYRMNVIMVREGDQWYVDPNSLKTYEAAETTDPNATVTPSPSPTPFINANTPLYYNPDGGTKYHMDPYCKSTHQKYLPFKGVFSYSQLNQAPYNALSPCNVCGAPLRQ